MSNQMITLAFVLAMTSNVPAGLAVQVHPAQSPKGHSAVLGRKAGDDRPNPAAAYVELRCLQFVQASHRAGIFVTRGMADNTVVVGRLADGKRLVTFKAGSAIVWNAAVSHDGSRVAAACHDGFARLFSVKSGRLIRKLGNGHSPVQTIAFDMHDRNVFTGNSSGSVQLWDAHTGRPILDIKAHDGGVWSMQLCPDGSRLVTAGEDHNACVWNAATGGLIARLPHSSGIYRAIFGQETNEVITGSADGRVRVWDTGRGKCTSEIPAHKGLVWSLALSQGGRQLATSGEDRMIYVWNMRSGSLERSFGPFPNAALAVTYLASDRSIAAAFRRPVSQ